MINLTKLNKKQQPEVRNLGRTKLSRQSSESAYKSPTYQGQKVSRVIGTPFQIRIPTKELNYLIAEVQNLKSKCLQLESTISPENKAQFKQLTESMRKIQDHANLSTYTQQFVDGDVSIQQRLEDHSIEKVKKNFNMQNYEKSYHELLKNLNDSQKQISTLQKEKNSLQKLLNQRQNQNKHLKTQNQILKQRIRLLIEQSQKMLPLARQITEQNDEE